MSYRSFAIALVSSFVVVSSAPAAFVAYAANPTTNSTDWAAGVTALGGVINNNVNFNAHPTGGLQPNFYLGSDGVTLTAVGDVNTVLNDAGPGQSNTSSTPLSSGEGPHPVSNYLFDGGAASSLTIDFATPVTGAGLFVIDYFNPNNDNPLTLSAYTGANGTGTLIGTANAAAFNFQSNNVYFLGVISTLGDIRSVVFTDVNSVTGDTTGIDDIRFAPAGGTPTVVAPLPPTVLLAGFGLVGMLGLRRRRLA